MRPAIYYVGLVGNHQSGKTTGADELAYQMNQMRGVRALRVNMADRLRDEMAEVLPARPGEAKHNAHPLERPAMQYTGEMRRLQDRNYWLRYALTDAAVEADLAEDHNHAVKYGDLEDQDQIRALVVISADAYNWNEMFCMDALVAVRNSQVEIPFGPELPETVRQTNWVLSRTDVLREMADADGRSLFRSFRVTHPSQFSNAKNIELLARDLRNHLNLTKLRTLGIPEIEPPVEESPEIPIPYEPTPEEVPASV